MGSFMFTILLVLIYIAFISLGLPDGLLGAAWPIMHQQLDVPISYAGIVAMIISAGTIVSSLLSDKMIRKFGTGKVTAVSVCLTALALYGFSISNSFAFLCIWGIPYGLGAGSIDAALNNFVALHYKAKHMNWLHCFWGIGATVGPYIMGYSLTAGLEWTAGYRFVFVIQLVLAAILIFSLPLWKKSSVETEKKQEHTKTLGLSQLIKIGGAKPALIAFFAYCALEGATGLWGSSYMVLERGISAETAAKWIALFYLGITAGRFISGFISIKLNHKTMIRLGLVLTTIGVIILFLHLGNILLYFGFLLIGMGCAPIYPSMLHATPINFGKNVSQSIMGMQMACAYVGSTFMPPLVGLAAEHISIKLYPFFLLALLTLLIVTSERLNKVKKASLIGDTTAI